MESRRRVTLYDRMTGGDSSSRRDSLATLIFDDVVLGPNQNNNQMTAGRRDSLATLILDDVVLSNQKREPATGSSRTLLDIIRADEQPNTKDRKSWKAFKDKLRLKRTGGSAHQQRNDAVEDIPILTHNNNNSSSSSSRASNPQQNDVAHEDPENPAPIAQEQLSHRRSNGQAPPTESPFAGGDSSDEDNNSETRRAAAAAGPVSMSLMDLLETDGEMGMEGSRNRTSDDDDEDEDAEEFEGEEEEGVVEMEHKNNCCCVCMVRNKGAAFIPCGHTFCRVCCRELWVSRGSCPLCNNFILEILDIF